MNRAPFRRRLAIPAGFAAVSLLAGCVGDRFGMAESQQAAVRPAPVVDTYWCGDGGPLRLERRGGAVHLPDIDGGLDLPADPPGQSTRFARGGYVVTLDGADMQVARKGAPTVACTR